MKRSIFIAIFFLALLVLGALIYKDYGISLDEPAQRLVGVVNLNYVAQILGIDFITDNPHFAGFSNQNLTTLEDRHYGVIFELPAALLEVFFNPEDLRGIYLMRHLLTFFFYLVGMISLYGLANLRFKDWRISLLTCAMLITSPRLFSDAFYNDKDIVFMSVFLLTSLTMIWFLKDPSWKRAILHAITSAIAIDTRLIGIVIPLISISILSIRFFNIGASLKRVTLLVLIYLTVCSLASIALWPYLWENPTAHLFEAFEFISRHPHSAALTFQGREILTNQLPWYYIPVWISITTPILYLIFFGIGSIENICMLVVHRLKILKTENQLIDAIFFGLFLGPIAAIAISHTSIYNGWRHLYFVYPFFVLISMKGLIKIWDLMRIQRHGEIFVIGLVSANFIYTASWMMINHPLQNLYFNSLAGKNWNTSYEVDYWGLAHRLALQKILMRDNSDLISIWPGSNSKFKSGEPTVFSDQLLLENPKNRLRVITPENPEESKYLIASSKANYSPNYLSQHGMFEKVDSVSLDGNEILTIFLRRDYKDIPTPKNNQRISFSQDGLGIFYLNGNKNPPINWEQWSSSEWQIPEAWGTWSNGNTASLKLPQPGNGSNSLSMKVRSFAAKNSAQNITIWINGKSIKEISLASFQSKEIFIDLQSDMNSKNEIYIEFRGLSPQSPKSLGLSQDDRKIAIGIESIQFL